MVVGDETGLVKKVLLKTNKVQTRIGKKQDRALGVTHMAWAGEQGTPESTILVGRRDGLVSILNIEEEEGSVESELDFEVNSHPFAGLDIIRKGSERRIISCTTSGQVRIVKYPFTKKPFTTRSSSSLTVGDNVACMRLDPFSYTRFAVGGKEHLLRLWDIESGKVSFKAKNVPHDFLDLRLPVWIKDIQFLPENPNTFLTATAYHQVRVYDTRASERAVCSLEVGKYAIMSAGVSPDGRYVVTGDGAGFMYKIDLRKRMKIGGFRGCGGSIRSVQYHPTLPFVASCSFDRHVRIFHEKSRKIVSKVYLKQRLTGLLFSTAIPEPEEKEEEKDVEEVWGELENRSKKKKETGKTATNGDSNRKVKKAKLEKESEEEEEEEDSDSEDEIGNNLEIGGGDSDDSEEEDEEGESEEDESEDESDDEITEVLTTNMKKRGRKETKVEIKQRAVKEKERKQQKPKGRKRR